MNIRTGRPQSLSGTSEITLVSLTGWWLTLVLLASCGPPPAVAPTASPASTRIRTVDGTEARFVSAGDFLMGSLEVDPKAGDDEKPQHTVFLDAFWIDRTEVTNAQFVRFLNALGEHRAACGGHDCAETQIEDKVSHIVRQDERYLVEPGFEDHPATQVSWHGAQAYCHWAGARLPTEAEWEKAARGVDGRPYPWGDHAPGCDRAQYGDCGGMTVPVGSRPAGASPYGALDLAGNVWEWVADWYDPAYYSVAPAHNPAGPDTGVRKVFRGGSWGYPPAFLRVADRARNRPTYAGFNVGFRCAATNPPR